MTRSIVLIISGSIAAYKSLDLIRRLREQGDMVRCIVTKGGQQFVTPMAVAALSEQPVYTELFSLKDEVEMGHIRLSREADVIVVAPASANMIAKMANGYADDMASATLLASNKPVLVAPAMNTQMWNHPATQRNVAQIQNDGAVIIDPASGMLACGEVGAGRMAEVDAILAAINVQLGTAAPLAGKKALVTSGPTHEAIDPVRYIGNRSSGKQGYAVAQALAAAGAEVTLVSGPTALADPKGVKVIRITSADAMLAACEQALPVDIAVYAAAVGDWKPQAAANKIKKRSGQAAPALELVENTDILQRIANHPTQRPALVIGFAAETENVVEYATQKRVRKNADWIVANDVSGGKGFEVDDNQVVLVTAAGAEEWPLLSKQQVAQKLVENIIKQLGTTA